MKTNKFAVGLAVFSIFALVSYAQSAETYIRFGEGYLVNLGDDRMAIGNSAGVNVVIGQYIGRKAAVQGEYASYSGGPSVGLLALRWDFETPSKALIPFISVGVGTMDYRWLGIGGATKAGLGLNYSFKPSFSPELTLGLESSWVGGFGTTWEVLYMNNALMLGLHF